MPTDTSVKFLHSAMVGAPSLAGQAGSLLNLLDACLVNGFNLVSVDSIVIAGGIGTIMRGAGLSFEVGAVALVAGAAVTGGSVNGEQKILSATATTATFDATGLADQAATGTITARMAPLGWSNTAVAAGTNIKAYKPTDVTATGALVRVDDAGTTSARVRAYATMSDVNTGTLPTPLDTQVSGGMYWPKSSAADATTRPWVLCGDGKLFYLMVAYSSNTSAAFGLNHVFGDFNAVKSPDPFACLLQGFNSSSFGTNGANTANDFDDGNPTVIGTGLWVISSYTGFGNSYGMRKAFPLVTGGGVGKSGSVAGHLPFPNPADGGVYLAPQYLIDHTANVFRGTAPGLYCFPQFIGSNVFNNRESLTGVAGFPGRTFKVINSNIGCFAFDVTGPWR